MMNSTLGEITALVTALTPVVSGIKLPPFLWSPGLRQAQIHAEVDVHIPDLARGQVREADGEPVERPGLPDGVRPAGLLHVALGDLVLEVEPNRLLHLRGDGRAAALALELRPDVPADALDHDVAVLDRRDAALHLVRLVGRVVVHDPDDAALRLQ